MSQRAEETGHQLFVFPDAKHDLLGCGACGALAQVKAHYLKKVCPAEFTSISAKNYWEAICKSGRHPSTGEMVGHPVPVHAESRRFFALCESQAVFLEEDPENT